MKRIFAALLLPLTIVACGPTTNGGATASTSFLPEALPLSPPVIPSGTSVLVQLDQPIGPTTASVNAGRFTATVIEPVRSSAGEILVPMGAVVEGKVVGTRALRAPRPELIGMKIHRVDIGGVSYPLASRVTGVDIALADDDSPIRLPGRSRLGSSEAMIPGTVIEDSETFLEEFELGHDPGTVISLGRNPEWTLPAGARIRLELVEILPMQTGHR